MGIHFPICPVYYLQILYKVKKVTRLNFYFVSLFVCQSFALFSSFCQLLRCTDNRIFNIMKVYIERNNLQVELIRYSKHGDFIHVICVKLLIQCNIAHRT